MMKDNTRIS